MVHPFVYLANLYCGITPILDNIFRCFDVLSGDLYGQTNMLLMMQSMDNIIIGSVLVLIS
jgi:hypothetical protein